jgi:integrase
VPLPPLALQVLIDLRAVSGDGPWAFVGRRGAPLGSNPARWTDLVRKACGLDFTLHDLRRTCATGCARLGATKSTVSRILGHKAIAGTIAVSGTYDRFDRLPEIRSALAVWSTYVESHVADEEKRGEVVAFGRISAPTETSEGAQRGAAVRP